MNEVAKIRRGEVTNFDPEKTRLKLAAIEYGIEEARRIKDWPALQEAVEQKIDEQRDFVVWWDVATPEAHRPKTVPVLGQLSADKATELTGISKQQVSRWRKKLADI